MHRHAPEHEASRLRASSLGSMYSRPPNSANRIARVSYSPEEYFQASLTPSMLMTSPPSSAADLIGGQGALAPAQEHYGGLYSDETTGVLMASVFATEGSLDPALLAETSTTANQPFPVLDSVVPPSSSPELLLSLASTTAPMRAETSTRVPGMTSEPFYPPSRQNSRNEEHRPELQEVLDFIQEYGR
ncbi:hypothetical protein FA10DRAFT_267463 [Acaromyces ingoldii]|uniref:Uncharacterized protein n=1 Tax=Acaromyces ingoldii TaxID=215250 RepID=A0A316YP97_9BASI|nr:hypothetical protein FA10DRAFT_267463 [Acaromyces ingoldii]PWN91051.1 hypothetical protein FA10DRAFT_267463 [Acaromyces ingoldii]